MNYIHQLANNICTRTLASEDWRKKLRHSKMSFTPNGLCSPWHSRSDTECTCTVRQFTPTYRTDSYPSIDPTKTDLSGKTVLITGASKGIGAATSISFARAGASNIIIGARSPLAQLKDEMLAAAKSANRPEPNILCLKLNVSSLESVEAAAKQVAETFNSKVDILINNAGYLETFKPFHESDPHDWWKTYEVNIRGIHLMCRSFIPMLLTSSLKTIVNTDVDESMMTLP